MSQRTRTIRLFAGVFMLVFGAGALTDRLHTEGAWLSRLIFFVLALAGLALLVDTYRRPRR